MDAATLLEQYTQDLSNLPAEVVYLLEELREKDMKFYELRKRIQQRDSQLHKYIKQNGSLVKHPKESQIYDKIREDFEKAEKLQEEKCLLSNTALFLISKHLTKLEKDVERLEADGTIQPFLSNAVSDDDVIMTDSPNDVDHLSSQISFASLSEPSLTSSSSSGASHHKKQPNPLLATSTHKRNKSRTSTPSLPHDSGNSVNTNSNLNSNNIITTKSRRIKSESPAPVLRGNTSDLESHPEPVSRPNSSQNKIPGTSATVSIPGVTSSQTTKSAPNSAVNSNNRPRNVSGGASGANGGTGNDDDELYCFCQQVSYGDMIACDNSNCKYEWFHYGCVGLKEPPQGIWYCPDCTKEIDNGNSIGGRKKEKRRR